MAIQRADIEKLCYLARIDLTEDTAADTAAGINRVLELIDQLRAADTAGIAPLAHPLEETQRLREDRVEEEVDRDALQAIAPAVESGLYLVPRVIE
ncbi:MAG: Asp-tRNA(Asn)/Glu-tRNA(Gln) amidotransferase GatCAB subunit C [Porticoccaceae bacterium]|jgi:aspartyl-tRNA(Asn)/glutamyl-tRNA(Gln) amidotransferase subunit C|nr:Asp-tRNA(Asn)/Glu-tRNA(Gln) amidotransferase GatCAB subunit C [Porticoccaceae bacterium]